MRIAKIFLVVIVVLALIGASGLAYLATHLDRHKGLLEIGASTALGREIRIDDGVEVDWSLRPTLALSGLSIANPTWAERKVFARVAKAFVQVDIPALLQGDLKLTRLALSGADLNLEVGPDGRGNWDFDPRNERRTNPGVEVSVNALQIEEARVGYRASSGAGGDLDIDDLVLRQESDGRRVLKARMLYRDLPITLAGESGTAPAAGAGGWPFSARATLQDTELKISGHALAFGNVTGMTLELQSSRLDLQSLSRIFVPNPLIKGSLQRLTGRWQTTGGGPQAWIDNLEGKLEIGSGRLAPAEDTKKHGAELTLRDVELTVAPNQATRLSGQVTYAEQLLEFELTGAAIEDLFRNNKRWQQIHLSTNGRFAGRPFEIEGTAGPLSALLAASALDVDLEAHHHETRVRVKGTLANVRTLEGSRVVIDATGPDLSRLATWFGLDLPEGPAFSLTARTALDDHRLRVRDLEAKVGNSDLAGELSLSYPKVTVIKGRLESQLLELPSLTASRDIGTKATWLEWELPPQVLRGIEGTLQWQVGRVRTADKVDFEGVKLDASLQNGHLAIAATAGEERLGADINLKPLGADWHFTLHHKGKLDLSWVGKDDASLDEDLRPPLALDLSLNARGRSVSEILGSADGSLELVIGGGHLDEKVARYVPLGGIVTTLVKAISEAAESAKPRSQLECAVLKLDIAKGVATSPKGLALRTDTFNVLGGGAIELQTGEIDLHFKTAQRKGLGINLVSIADRFIRLTGTVQNPVVSVSVGGFLVHGGAAWATGGVSLAYDLFARRLLASRNPCETVLQTGAP